MSRPRLIVVSAFAQRQFEPRGVRTRALVNALRSSWDVEVIAAAAPPAPPAQLPVRAARHVGERVKDTFALDAFEPWSRRRFRGWRPRADLAVLVGYPFSPVVLSARALARRGIPYVVDISDPWVVTSFQPVRPSFGRWRRLRAERTLWSSAVAAIVTTPRQGDALRAEFPHLQIHARPNGYAPAAASSAGEVGPLADDSSGREDRQSHSRLEIGHFGNLYQPRLDIAPFFTELLRSERWREIAFHQYGPDLNRTLARLPAGVRAVHHQPVPWEEVIAHSRNLDAALVVGNVDPAQLPSKVVQYLTLPIPRIAVLANLDGDSIADYIADKPGWLAVTPGDPLVAEKVMSHVSRDWTATDLAPPASESWERVAQEIRDFVALTVGAEMPRGQRPRPYSR